MEEQQIKNIVEAGLLVAGKPLNIAQVHALFQDDDNAPDKAAIRTAIASLQEDYETRGIELVEIASGFRLQSRQAMAPWMMHLFQEKSPRYSRALLETLVLIAYKQPITRAEIEEVRGVAVSSSIVRTLQERNWVNVVGHKDLPGKPALLGTTRQFLDYFNLKRLDDLPTLGEIKDIDQIDAFAAEEAALIEQGLIEAPTESEDSIAGEGASASEETSGENQSAVVGDDAETGSIAAKAIAVGGIDIALTDDASEDEVAAEFTGEFEASDNIEADAELEAGESIDVEMSTAVDSDDASAETQLKQVLEDFASEHQQQVDVQLDMESRTLSKPVGPAANSDEDGQPSADAGGGYTDDSMSSETEEVELEEVELEEVAELEAALAGGASSSNTAQQDVAQQNDSLPQPGDTLH